MRHWLHWHWDNHSVDCSCDKEGFIGNKGTVDCTKQKQRTTICIILGVCCAFWKQRFNKQYFNTFWATYYLYISTQDVKEVFQCITRLKVFIVPYMLQGIFALHYILECTHLLQIKPEVHMIYLLKLWSIRPHRWGGEAQRIYFGLISM